MEGVLQWILLLAAVALPCGLLRAEVSSDLRSKLAWQIALDREGFSPGLVDGKIGGKTRAATREFQIANDLRPTASLDEATKAALKIDESLAISEHIVERSDVEGITPFEEDWNIRAGQSEMGYYSALDSLAERFHTSKDLLQALNPSADFNNISVGAAISVPAVVVTKPAKASSLRVDLKDKIIYALNSQGKVISMFHCSIAAKAEKRPSGDTKVIVVAQRPDYTFDPAGWPEVHNVTRKLRIAPGPRNPVGLAWIGLDLPGYGIHGTPHPEMIGKTGSHGCFRLANWDAVRLAKMIRVGCVVSFVSQD